MIRPKTLTFLVLEVLYGMFVKDIPEMVEDMLISNSYIDRRYLYDPMQRELYLHWKKQRFKGKLKRNMSWKDFDKKKLYNTVGYLKRKGYLSQGSQGDMFLTSKAAKEMFLFNLERVMKDKQRVKWDGKWRILFFDIPEREKTKREILRNILKRCGFKKCQKSVWVTKNNIIPEVKCICDLVSISRYVVLLKVKKIVLGEIFFHNNGE